LAEIAHGDDVVGRFATREQHEANGRRIVAAVNACRGISTEALQQGVVRELLEVLDYVCATLKLRLLDEASNDEVREASAMATAAKAKATGGKA
jgi:hypothetical protein